MSPQPPRTDNLALAFQELITVGERLRCNRQTVADAASFRAQIWAAVKAAGDQARNRGYAQEDIELATFAVIAFVDESILNLRHPIFSDWPRQPLQEERYGHHVAGEIFFQNLQKLLVRTDTAQLADLLEVYYLCMMLGFAGRYSLGGRGELRAIMQQTGDKLQRIRKTSTILSPDCQPPGDQVRQVTGDSVARALLFVAIGCAVLMIALFIVFQVMLGKGVDNLQKTAAFSPYLQRIGLSRVSSPLTEFAGAAIPTGSGTDFRGTCKTRHAQAKPPAPPLQVHCLPWWGRRFRLPRPLAAEFCKYLFSLSKHGAERVV